MNLFKRAMISLKRSPMKTGLLFLMVVILGSLVSGAIAVIQAMHQTDLSLRRSLPPVVTVTRNETIGDYISHMDDEEWNAWLDSTDITYEMLQEISQLPYVADFDFYVTGSMFGDDLVKVPPADISNLPDYNDPLHGIAGLRHFQLKGVNRGSFTDFNTGLIELVEGRTFTDEEARSLSETSVALISRPFAQVNGLNVGDEIRLDNTIFDEFREDVLNLSVNEIFSEENVLARETYQLEVIGIFEIAREIVAGNAWLNDILTHELTNQIYVPFQIAKAPASLLEELQDFYWPFPQLLWSQILFVLNDPLDLMAFEAAANEILAPAWQIEDLSNIYADMQTSMENMRWIANLILWGTVVAAIVTLSLLVTLFLYDRRKEIGIYLALGENRIKIVTQMMVEALIIGTIAIMVSLFIGNLMANHFSEDLLHNELMSQTEQRVASLQNEGQYQLPGLDSLSWFSPGDMSIEEMMAHYDLTLTLTSSLIFYGMGSAILIFSSALPILYVLRLEPNKILLDE